MDSAALITRMLIVVDGKMSCRVLHSPLRQGGVGQQGVSLLLMSEARLRGCLKTRSKQGRQRAENISLEVWSFANKSVIV